MALASDLVQIGFISRHADFLGDTIADTLTALGTDQAHALALTASINCVTIVTATNNGVILPTIVLCKYSSILVRNDDAMDTLTVYPATGQSINSLAANAGFNIAANSAKSFTRVSSTKWVST